MALKMRSFTWEKDFELVRAFLILTYNLTRSFQNWIPSMCARIKIWEKTDDSDTSSVSKIVAVTFCKPSGDCWIQIHPDHRFVEKEIVLWIEKQRREIKSNKTLGLELRFYVDETNEKRKALLTELGYENSGLNEQNRKRPIDKRARKSKATPPPLDETPVVDEAPCPHTKPNREHNVTNTQTRLLACIKLPNKTSVKKYLSLINYESKLCMRAHIGLKSKLSWSAVFFCRL